MLFGFVVCGRSFAQKSCKTVLLLFIYVEKTEIVDMSEQSSIFHCSMCFFNDGNFGRFCKHMVRFHKHDPHFVLNCGFPYCSFVTKSWPCFKMHVKRKHEISCDFLFDRNDDDECTSVDDYMPPVAAADSLPPQHIILSAAYLLSLEAENKLTVNGVDTIVSSTAGLLSSQFLCVKQQILQKLADSGYNVPHDILNDVLPDGCFQGLESSCKRVKFYKEFFGLVEPQEVYLGSSLAKRKGKVVSCRQFGVIVPFVDSLKALLSMPEVWHHILSPHTSNSEIMRDVCDGYVWRENDLFSRNPSALQIFLNTDDIEIVNPIGTHVKNTN